MITRLSFTLFLLMLMGCSEKQPIESQTFSWTRDSKSGDYSVTIRPQEGGKPPIGEYHPWVILINDQYGKAIEEVAIQMGGGMASHHHGLPSQPIVERYLGNGKYLIEGVLFNMMGEWTLNFSLEKPGVRDRVVFIINLTH